MQTEKFHSEKWVKHQEYRTSKRYAQLKTKSQTTGGKKLMEMKKDKSTILAGNNQNNFQ